MPVRKPPTPRVSVGSTAVAAVFSLAPVLHFVGLVLTGLGAFMTLPAIVELAGDGDGDGYPTFVGAAAVTLFGGVSLVLAFSGEAMRINLHQAVLAVLLTWIAACFFGALPFVFATRPLSITDAVFETVSGLTATGGTVYVGLDTAPRGILLWRFLLVWLGGFGLVTFAVLILPYLRIGGLQLFTIDLSARPGKFLPKTPEVVAQIALIYGVLTLACAISFGAAGMGTFDALGHAMSALATGGFSSHDAGLGYFKSPAIEWIATLFMLVGAMPFVLFIYLLRGQPGPLLQE